MMQISHENYVARIGRVAGDLDKRERQKLYRALADIYADFAATLMLEQDHWKTLGMGEHLGMEHERHAGYDGTDIPKRLIQIGEKYAELSGGVKK